MSCPGGESYADANCDDKWIHTVHSGNIRILRDVSRDFHLSALGYGVQHTSRIEYTHYSVAHKFFSIQNFLPGFHAIN